MARRGKMAAMAWVATLASSTALLPLVDQADWIFQAALLLGLITTVGVLARWRGLNGVLTGLIQVATGIVLLTLTTVPGYALFGIIPGPAALEQFGTLLAAGGEDVGSYTSPAPLTEGIRLLLICGVLLVGIAVDLLAATLRSAAAAGLPLLAMYSAAAGISQEGASWPYFLIAAAGFLALLLTESRYQLAEWGRYFPGPAMRRPDSPEVRTPGPRLRTGRRIGAASLGVALAVPLALPALGDGLLDPGGRGGGSGGGMGAIAVNPVVALQDQLTQPQNRTVLTYETTSERPREMYLRLVSLDRFDGERWYSSEALLEGVPEAPWPVAGLSSEVDATVVTTRITADELYSQPTLPVPSPAIDIAVDGDWNYDIFSRTLRSARNSQTSAGRTYEVEHLLVEPSGEQLAQAPEPASAVIRDDLTRVPDGLPDSVREKALEVTEGAANAHEQAVALQEWFTREGGFRYNTNVESGTGTDAIANFLEAREGFCIHFAFSMAAMARSLGIPAQVSVGFTPGTARADGSYTVGLHNAHAWPELYFEGVGWVRYEPTPGQGSTPAYTRPEPAQPETEDPEAETPEAETPEPERDPAETSPTDPGRCDPIMEPEACAAQQGQEQTEDEESMALWPLIWGSGAALLAVALLLTPMLWRDRLRRRRLAPEAGVLAAWEELLDTAWDLGAPPDASQTPRQEAHRVVRAGDLTGEPAAAVHRVADAVERELYAPAGTAQAGPQLGEDVRTASAALRAASTSREIRFRARMFPASASRVANAVAERYARLTSTITQRLTLPLNRLARRGGGSGAKSGAGAGAG